jgi:small GTP-binding protein
VASGQTIEMDIWDTAGQDAFQSMTEYYLHGAVGVILAFDLTANQTFIDLERWIQIVKDACSPGFVVLVGNKNDLEDQRATSSADAEEWARCQSAEYFETSAVTGSGTEMLIAHLAEKAAAVGSPQAELAPLRQGKSGHWACLLL